MSHGLRDDDGNPVLSLEGDPWKTFPVKQIRPSKDDYTKEVIRRWNQTNGGSASAAKVGPRPRAWNLPKIHNHDDVVVVVIHNNQIGGGGTTKTMNYYYSCYYCYYYYYCYITTTTTTAMYSTAGGESNGGNLFGGGGGEHGG